MTFAEGAGRRAQRITQLVKHLVADAQSAGDLEEFDMANQLLRVAETLMSNPLLSENERINLAKLLIGAHQRFWQLRDRGDDDPLPCSIIRLWKH